MIFASEAVAHASQLVHSQLTSKRLFTETIKNSLFKKLHQQYYQAVSLEAKR